MMQKNDPIHNNNRIVAVVVVLLKKAKKLPSLLLLLLFCYICMLSIISTTTTTTTVVIAFTRNVAFQTTRKNRIRTTTSTTVVGFGSLRRRPSHPIITITAASRQIVIPKTFTVLSSIVHFVPASTTTMATTSSSSTTTTTRLYYQQNFYSNNNEDIQPVMVESTSSSQRQVENNEDNKNSNHNSNSNNRIRIIKTNRELAEERIQTYRQKREARQKSIATANEKNYMLKQMLHGITTTSTTQNIPSISTSTNDTTSTNKNKEFIVPAMYQVKILVCDILRHEMKLSGREKRGRIFLEYNHTATQSIQQLQYEMHAFFRALKKDSYLLYGGYPMLSKDGKIIASISNITSNNNGITNTSNGTSDFTNIWPIQTDYDVQVTFQRAMDWFESVQKTSSTSTTTTSELVQQQLQRPSIVIHVKKNPNMKPPPPPPEYLTNMLNPMDSTHISMLSFYAFPINGIDDPNEYAITLRKLFKPFQALGRIYVAHEGINAQMSVPTNVLHNFQSCCNTLPNGVGTYLQHNGGINIDPIPLTRDEYAVAGIQAAATVPFTPITNNNMNNSEHNIIQGTTSEVTTTTTTTTPETTTSPSIPTPPFSNLHIRVRQQIVADGFTKSYDWQQAGYDMPPLEWHAKLKEEIERRKNGDATNATTTGIRLLDCRNIYETDVGRFETAEPLETHTFRDSWDALKERLADTPKDAPIMTYCTGGIRCVKVGAYLTQELGFTNVSRLAGGIIAYDRILNEQVPDEQPLFKGTNFVFDGRLGRPITEDTLATCLTCGSETSAVSNCRNENCHRRIVQCETCRTSLLGTCSDACRHRLMNGAMRYRRNSFSDSSTETPLSNNNNVNDIPKQMYGNVEEYVQGHSSPVPSIYPEIEMNTRILIPSGSHMVSGNVQGKLLTQFASMTREGRILELGTFTGYGTTCLLEGAGLVGRTNQNNNESNDHLIGTREAGPYVLTMERDAKAYDVAVSQLSIVCQYGICEDAAEVLCGLRGDRHHQMMITNVSDTASTSFVYDNIATCELLKVSDGLAIVEEMSAGRGALQHIAPFDLVYLDADKTRLLEYTDALLSSDRVLKKGGLIVVDNVLWKGLVVEANNGVFSSLPDDDLDSEEEELRKNRRARKLASKMHRFNSEIVKDPRVHVQVLPIRDGLSLIRKL